MRNKEKLPVKRRHPNRYFGYAYLFSTGMASFLFLAFQVMAQVPPLPAAAPAPVPAAGATPAVVQRAAQPGGEAQVSPQLKFEEATLTMVLKEYGEATRRTLLLDPKLPAPPKGITLRNEGDLTMDEYLQAIETVLSMNGIGLVKVGEKFLKVVPIEGWIADATHIRSVEEGSKLTNTDEIVSQMIQLKYIDVEEGTKLLESLKFQHPYAKVTAFPRNNCILFTDTSSNVGRILDVLKSVDQPIEAREEPKVIKILYAKASLIKTKLEEIIVDTQKDQSTAARTRDSGRPGFVTTPAPAPNLPIAPPGVIRPVVPKVTDVGTVDNTNARILDDAERGIIRGKVKIVADDRVNILIIITRPENMAFFDKIVKVLDVATDPDVTVKVLRLEFADSEQVASQLNTLIGAQQQNKEGAKPGTAGKADAAAGTAKSVALDDFAKQQSATLNKVAEGEGIKSKVGELSAQNIKILSDKRINSLVIMASKTDLATIEEIVKEMDMAVSQVLIEVIILDVNLKGGITTGVDWIQRSLIAYNKNSDGSRKPMFGFAGGGGGGYSQTTPLADFTKTFSPGQGLTYYTTFFGLNADLVAKMIATDSKSRVLSSPIILTTDNKKAQLDVTKDQYFYKGQNYVPTGVGSYNPVDNVDTKSVGLKLSVTPHINKNKNVQMEIVQEISNATEKQLLPGQNQGEWPVMSIKKFEATVSVRSGMTIVLGGLADDTKSISHNKIPLLGDIPLLGLLFGKSDKSKERSEILVFITPYVMDSTDEIEFEARRRQMAVGDGDDGKWTKGWSNSNLGTPGKAELKETEKQEIEMEKNARAAAKKLKAEAMSRAAASPATAQVLEAPAPAVDAMLNVEAQSTMAAPKTNTVQGPVVTNKQTAAIDPALESFIRKNERKYDRDLKKIDQRIMQETMNSDVQNKP